MKVFLDFDDCLFDTTRYPGTFWEGIDGVMKMGGWTEEQFEVIGESFSDSAFDSGKQYHYRAHLELLEKTYPHGKLPETLAKTEDFMQHLEKYLFPDTEPFLQTMKKEDVILVTYGDEDFQRAKVRGSGIEKYVREIIVVTGPKLVTIQNWIEKNKDATKLETFWYVDDKAEYFEGKRFQKRPITVLMQRGVGAKENADTDFIVKDCKELQKLLREKESGL